MNRSTRRKRVLLVSCAVILLCVTIIVGSTYALFTETVRSTNHLEAGNLDITLVRTKLETRMLGADGKLVTATNNTATSFTEANQDNLFGIPNGATVIPGAYFDATMEIANGGNVAFGYSVRIQLNGESTELAEQLTVTVRHPDGTEKSMKLSELGAPYTIDAGEMVKGNTTQTFGVRVAFDKLDDAVNNTAMLKKASFDLIVSATQSTQ